MTGFWKRVFGRPGLPDVGAIREPTLDDVFGICCGPRLFNQALKLHGEELSRSEPGESEKPEGSRRRSP